ncbi:uncharacterized protein RJT20DRAFT_58075 [Scheffersomyces xylosifermentans]|uniref:uncharacterized protein n=1 Tax=Scheffersomyces xylosifermentans TaxID=1304137 RepID=UPI00315D4D25
MSSPETVHSMVSAVSNLNTHTSFTVASSTNSAASITPPTSPASIYFKAEKVEMHQPYPHKATMAGSDDKISAPSAPAMNSVANSGNHTSKSDSSVTLVSGISKPRSASTSSSNGNITLNPSASNVVDVIETQSRKSSSGVLDNIVLQDDDEYRDIAIKLYQEDFVSIQPEEYTQFLAASDEESAKIRTHYMDLFSWDENLLKSTRNLCSKLYLKGESQEIDRILSSFTKSYLKQHPTNIFCTRNFEQIYIIMYSLILLNTALHNSELSRKSKISQADFIKNTFSTFMQQNPSTSKKLSIKQRITIEQELSNFYDDLARQELHLKQANPMDEEVYEHRRYVRQAASARSLSKRSELPPLPPQQQQYQKSPSLLSSPRSMSNVLHPENMEDLHFASAEIPQLSRQPSNSSIWSTDTSSNRRTSLVMKRMATATSAVSQYTAGNPLANRDGNKNARVGFTRALMSDQQKLYKNGNPSQYSQMSRSTNMTLRNRQSMDHLRNNGNVAHSLTKRASRTSIVSRESTNSIFGDDNVSMLSIDTQNINRIDFQGLHDDFEQQQNLENFNIDDYQDQYDLTLELSGSPYLKEGLLKLKVYNNDQQDTTQEIAPPISSAASTASTSGSGGHRGFFSFFSRNSNQNSNKAASAAVGTSSTLLNPNKFVENFVVVSKGELSLYSFDPKIIKKHQQRLRKIKQKRQQQLMTITEFDDFEEENDDEEIGDGNWLKNAAKIGNYNLCSTFAQLEKAVISPASGSSVGKKTYMWSLNFPKISKKPAKKFMFESGTKEIALEFVNTCNFWASKITAIPTLEESVSSIEYGWTNLDSLIAHRDQFKRAKHIQKWEPVVRGVYLSNYIVVDELDNEANHLGMMKQFVKTLKYYDHTKKLDAEFKQMKQKFIQGLPQKQYGGSNYSKVIHNFDAKLEEYKMELNKYKNYLIILGFGLQLRFDLEEQDRFEATLDDEDIVYDEENSPSGKDDDDLTRLVKYEIKKLFFNMKDIGKIIPTFQSSKSIQNLTTITHQQFCQELEDGRPFPLVKSPKTFTLANFKDNESPINQLMQTANSNRDEAKSERSRTFSTDTIKEEDEPEELETKVETPNMSTESFASATMMKEPMLAIRATEMPTAVIIS